MARFTKKASWQRHRATQCYREIAEHTRKAPLPGPEKSLLRYRGKASAELAPLMCYADLEVYSTPAPTVHIAQQQPARQTVAASSCYVAVGRCGSPPSLSPLMSPLMSPLLPAPFLVQKALKNVRVRRVRFSCRTASGMPEPPNSQVFGRKRAPDVSFPLSARKSGEFQPAEHVTACHRFVTALFGAEKCAKGLEKRNQLRFDGFANPG